MDSQENLKGNEEYKDIVFDGRPEAWRTLFGSGRILLPGTVVVFFGAAKPLDAVVAGWHLLISHVVDKGGNLLFPNIQHIVPANVGDRHVLKNIRAALEEQGPEIGWDAQQVKTFANSFSARELISMEGPELIKAIQHVPDGTAVAASCAHLYRFDDIEEEVFGSITAWSGIQYRWGTKERRYFPHMIRIVRDSLALAKRKGLFVTLFWEEYGPAMNDLPEGLRNDDDLVVLAAPVPKDLAINKIIPSLLDKIRTVGIDPALSELSDAVPDPKKHAQIASHLLMANGEFGAAWDILRPYLDELRNSDGTSALAIAQVAFAAGKLPESGAFLNITIKKGLDSIEDLNSIYQLAKRLRLSGVQEAIFERIKSEYPNHRITLSYCYENSFQKRDFASACDIAKRLGNSFDVYLCAALSKPKLDIDGLVKYASGVGRIDEARFTAALEAERRSEYPVARELASMVAIDSPFISGVMLIRTRILTKKLLGSDDLMDDDIEELKHLLFYVATHPADLDVRFLIDELFESDLEEPASKLILVKILVESLHSSFEKNVSAPIPETSRTDSVDSSLWEHEGRAFFRDFLESLPPNRGKMVGHGELPQHLAHRVSEGLLRSLLLLIQYGNRVVKDDSDLNFIRLLLHVVILISQKLNDASSDLMALRSSIAAMINAGFHQPARDLVETCLLTIPQKQPNQFIWRISQVWVSYSDACHRSGNIMTSLRYLCLSFIACKEPAINYDLLASTYRIAARLFGDLHLREYATDALEAEREIRIRLGTDKHFLPEIDAVALSIQVSNLGWDNPVETFIDLFAKADQLIKENQPEEMAPLLTIQASLYRMIKIKGANVSDELRKEFDGNLNKLPSWQKSLVDALLVTDPSRQNLIDAAANASKALNWGDLASQITHITILAHNAVRSAFEHNDINLFIVASAFLCQPILSLKSAEADETNSWLDSLCVQKWWFHLLAKGDPTAEALVEGHKVLTEISPPSLKSITGVGNVSLDQIVGILGADEAMMILTQDDQGVLYRAMIYSDGSFVMDRLDPNIWSGRKWQDWRRSFPRSYGRWNPPANPWDREQPSKRDVRESVAGLSLWPFKAPANLTIVADAKLFGFPFGLTLKNGDFLGEDLRISVAPSIPWLISARSRRWTGELVKKAWLGWPTPEIDVLHILRTRLRPILVTNEVEVVESISPTGLKHKALVLIASHGGVGLFDHFRTVSDKASVYSANEFASYFEDCGCVVLFVCNAGRTDTQTRSAETRGLVVDLLRNGVRCVIAPPWPLHIDVATLWLPAFFSCVGSGESAGYAVYTASREVCKTYDNPCAWGSLQIYGDTTFVLK
jgi:hypothetical protein